MVAAIAGAAATALRTFSAFASVLLVLSLDEGSLVLVSHNTNGGLQLNVMMWLEGAFSALARVQRGFL